MSSRSEEVIWVTPMDWVREFHTRFGLPQSDRPHVPDGNLVALRRRLLSEEAQEADDAQRDGVLVGVAQELADVVYVAYGTALTYGIDLDAVIEAVHGANMTKERGSTGKAVKGPGFVPADVAAVLLASDANASPRAGQFVYVPRSAAKDMDVQIDHEQYRKRHLAQHGSEPWPTDAATHARPASAKNDTYCTTCGAHRGVACERLTAPGRPNECRPDKDRRGPGR